MAAGDPTGDDLCSGTTNGNTLPEAPAAPEEREIDFGAGVELTEGVKYAIVAKAPDAEHWYDGNWSLQDVGGYANGDYRSSNDAGESWSEGGTEDLYFKTYADTVLKDSHIFEHTDTGGGIGGNTQCSQSFTATSTYTITSVKLNLYRQAGESPGTITVSIKATVGAPEKPTNPTPTDAADDVTLDQATISWEDGGGAETYNVYYGENEEGLTLVSEGQVETSFTISEIDYGSPFDYIISRSWRIDAINAEGTTTGDVWTFTTIAFDPPLPTGVTLDAEGNPTGTPTGENNMYTVKRLIAAANNAIWYGGV